jgi:putative addiction module component (TIGR02574 family)
MNTQNIKLNVPLSFNQIIDIVQQLSPKEKTQLITLLWDATDDKDIVITEKHQNIVRNRLKKMEELPESGLSWEEIEKKIKL